MSLPASYTIPQWCAAYQVNQKDYDALKERGLTPQELTLGSQVIITRRAVEKWEDQMLRQQSVFTGGIVSL